MEGLPFPFQVCGPVVCSFINCLKFLPKPLQNQLTCTSSISSVFSICIENIDRLISVIKLGYVYLSDYDSERIGRDIFDNANSIIDDCLIGIRQL